MGVMRFIVPRPERLGALAVERAFLTGFDDVPWRCRNSWSDGLLTVERLETDSGNLHTPWRVVDHGERMLATASLMERKEPYHLPVELARGGICRLKNQIVGWEAAGMRMPAPVVDAISQAKRHFSSAATSRSNALLADEQAAIALKHLEEASGLFVAACADYATQLRRELANRPLVLFGANLGGLAPSHPALGAHADIFNAAIVPLNWRQIEPIESHRDWSLVDAQMDWCQKRGLKICAGPLLQWDKSGLPDWLYLWDGDDGALRSLATDFIKAAVERYRGRVQIWQAAGRMNTNDFLSLGEDGRLRMTVMALELLHALDPRSPAVLSVDQPWAEFMARMPCDLSPMYFADTLLRADLGLAGVMLELNFGYYPGGSAWRSPADVARHLDRWSMLERPLLVSLTAPSSAQADPLATNQAAVFAPQPEHSLDEEEQCQWIEHLLATFHSKGVVQGIFFGQISDSGPHDFPHGGLLNWCDVAKPALAKIRALRRRYGDA